MNILLNSASMIPIYEQLMGHIKAEIASGALPAGAVLPSVRTLAAELRISALTVKKAYDGLEAGGLVVTVHGKGTYVAEVSPSLAEEQRRKQIEDRFAEAVDYARANGMNPEEIRELVAILLDA